MMYDIRGKQPLLIGYTHGSHWDPSDEIRDSYPHLRYADLGNVLAMAGRVESKPSGS